jgi:hypothetical protein
MVRLELERKQPWAGRAAGGLAVFDAIHLTSMGYADSPGVAVDDASNPTMVADKRRCFFFIPHLHSPL